MDEESSFRDLGSSVVKVLTMFTGELGFETTFKNTTRQVQSTKKLPRFKTYDFRLDHGNIWTNLSTLILYAVFIIEMCIILMNLTIGLSISNIQVILAICPNLSNLSTCPGLEEKR